jgi:stage II sporulation protein AB (anti-sigma F factor)
MAISLAGSDCCEAEGDRGLARGRYDSSPPEGVPNAVRAHIELEFPAVPEAIPEARRAISEMCEQLRLAVDLAERVRLAVTEAVTNCVLHAFDCGHHAATYMLQSRTEDNALVVVVHDNGVGMASIPTPMHRPIPGIGLGLGLRIIHELADSADVSSKPGAGTRVAMRFVMQHEPRPAPAD